MSTLEVVLSLHLKFQKALSNTFLEILEFWFLFDRIALEAKIWAILESSVK